MNKNGKYSINLYDDNHFQIKVNRNKNKLNNKIFPISTKSSRIQISPQNHISYSNRSQVMNNDEIAQKKLSKCKNKIYQLSKNSNLDKISNKQEMNKINNSARYFQKSKNEIRIIDTFNKIRDNYNNLNLSNKINKQSINVNHLKNKTNNLSDYKAKIANNKNRLKNSLFKAQSFNTEFKTNIKNLNKTNYIKEHNYSSTVNNNLIDDTNYFGPDNLFEITNFINHENNLGIYRNEIQYPSKNNNSKIYSSNKNDRLHKFLKDDSSNSNYLVLKTLNNEKYKSNILLDNAHNNIQNKKNLAKKYFQIDEKEKNKNYKKSTSIKNNNKLYSNVNTFIKLNDYNSQNLQEIYSPKIFSKGKKIKNTMDNYIANSGRHFFRKKCISRDKYNTDNNKDDYFDELVSNKDRTVYYKYRPNINCDLDRDRSSYISEYNINNYKYYNKKKNKNYIINNKLTYQKFQLISIFCDSVEKLLIFIIKCHFDFFINQIKQYINSKNYKYMQGNENNNILLLKRLNNKRKVKINIDSFEYNEKRQSLAQSLTKLNSSIPLKSDNDNKIYTFKVLSRNDITNDIYAKKSKSINRSQNIKINRYNIISNIKDEHIIKNIKKRKNLSFNKVYIPKHKNTKVNKYKSLKINTKFSNYNDLNNNSDVKNNTMYNIGNYQNTNPQNILPYYTVYNTINENENLIKDINHITTLKKIYTIKKKSNNSIISMNSSNNYDLNSNVNLSVSNPDINNKKMQLNSKNIYTKPLFKKIRKKILEKEEKDNKINFSSGKKRNDNDYNVIDNLFNVNTNYHKYNNVNTEEKNENKKKRMNKYQKEIEDDNLFDEFIMVKKRENNSKNNNFYNKSYENKNIINFINSNEKNKKKTKIENNNTDISTKLNNSNIIYGKNKKDTIQDYDIIRTIIVKDVCSKDKALNVFIKYYECDFPAFNSNNINIQQLKVISTDSITLSYINKSKGNNNENKTNKYLQQILTSIMEVDEKSKANRSINNSNSFASEEGSETNNLNRKYISKNIFAHNIVIYLTNILQNIYDDNKKMVLYLFMRNLKRIQNQIYLKDSLMQINTLYKNLVDYSNLNNNIYNNSNNNDNKIIDNGGNELDISNGEKDINKRNILFYSADYNLINLKKDHKNKIINNIELGSFLFKDLKIKEGDEFIKIKRHYSSSSINQIKNNGNMIICDKNDMISKKNKLKDIILRINKDIISYYFKFWKKSVNKYNIINNDIDNGMNLMQINNRRNHSNEKIIEINTDDLYIRNEVKFLDNGFDIEYDEIKIKNAEINNEFLLNKKKDEISYKILAFRYNLIKNSLKKKS